jgi:hypothetical protein
LQFRGIGTPRWQLDETLIPGKALRYHYVNPVACVSRSRKVTSRSAQRPAEKTTVAQTSLPYWRSNPRASAPRPSPSLGIDPIVTPHWNANHRDHDVEMQAN